MSMRKASPHMTTCEAYRMINDLCQSDSEKDQQIRDLCVLGIIVGKILSMEVSKEKLMELVKNRTRVNSPMKIMSKRLDNKYKHNWKNRHEIKEIWGIE